MTEIPQLDPADPFGIEPALDKLRRQPPAPPASRKRRPARRRRSGPVDSLRKCRYCGTPQTSRPGACHVCWAEQP